MQTVREAGETFDSPADFRLEEYLKGSTRADCGDGDHDVVLRSGPELAGPTRE